MSIKTEHSFTGILYTGRFIMFSVITNVYNKKGRDQCSSKNIDAPMLTRLWQEIEYRIDVSRVTRSTLIEHLQLSKKPFQISCGCEQFH
jgi:hypothetical protein